MTTSLKVLGSFAILALAAISIVGCAGLRVEDFVRVTVPVDAQQHGLPAKMTLAEARQAQVSLVSAAKQLNVEIHEAETAVAFFSGLSGAGIEAATGLPGAGVIVPALTFLAGWLGLRRPWDASTKEKQDAYNKGIEVGSALVKGGTA